MTASDSAALPAPEEPVVDIHKPKPVHNWREFLSEIGVIVIGVLIALGAEQVVEAIHSAHLAEQARHDVREEASVNLAFFEARIREGACLRRKLDAVEAKLSSLSPTEGATPVWVGRPNEVPIFAERWRAVTSSARIALFTPDEQGAFDNLWSVFGQFREAEDQEQVAWTDLRVLERWRGPIDSGTRFSLLHALAAARQADYKIRRTYFYAGFPVRALGLKPDLNFGPSKDAPDSLCLPLDTPLQVARRQVRDRVRDEY